jgi:hypothetical protein
LHEAVNEEKQYEHIRERPVRDAQCASGTLSLSDERADAATFTWHGQKGAGRALRVPTLYNPPVPREPLFTRDFIRLWLFAFVTFFSAFQLLPTIPFRIIELGGTKATAGMFLALYTYACAFAAPVTGSIADHIGRRRVLLYAALEERIADQQMP